MHGEVIDAGAVKVKDLLSRPLRVPRYQRDYEWTPKQEIGALVDDLFEHFSVEEEYGKGQDDDYLMGQIVMTRDSPAEIIDGQQRCITLFIVLAALRVQLASIIDGDPRVIRLQTDLTDLVADEVRPKLDHHDELAVEALRTLITFTAGDPDPNGTNDSLSNRRIIHGFRHVKNRLSESLPDDADKIKDFINFVLNQVKLIETTTADPQHALIIFERANDRGKPLDPADLLKNLVFQNADRERFGELDAVWKQIQKTTESIPNVRMIDFLRWYHLALPETGFYSTKRTLYRGIRDRRAEIGIDADPMAYVTDLEQSAGELKLMAVERLNPAGGAMSPFLVGMRALGGIRQKQHYPLLMAVVDWEPEEFEVIARGVERLLLVSYVTDHRSQALERTIRGLTSTIRELSGDDRAKVAASKLDEATKRIRDEGLYEEQFLRLNYEDSTQVVKFVLTKVHDGLYGVGQGRAPEEANGGSPIYESADVEHVWPRADAKDLGTEDDSEHVHRIGNLVLLDRSTNAFGGRRAAINKLRELYPPVDSRFIIARNLVERQRHEAQGPTTWANRMVDMTPTGFETWGPDQIDRLGREYLRLLDMAMPPASECLPG